MFETHIIFLTNLYCGHKYPLDHPKKNKPLVFTFTQAVIFYVEQPTTVVSFSKPFLF